MPTADAPMPSFSERPGRCFFPKRVVVFGRHIFLLPDTTMGAGLVRLVSIAWGRRRKSPRDHWVINNLAFWEYGQTSQSTYASSGLDGRVLTRTMAYREVLGRTWVCIIRRLVLRDTGNGCETYKSYRPPNLTQGFIGAVLVLEHSSLFSAEEVLVSLRNQRSRASTCLSLWRCTLRGSGSTVTEKVVEFPDLI